MGVSRGSRSQPAGVSREQVAKEQERTCRENGPTFFKLGQLCNFSFFRSSAELSHVVLMQHGVKICSGHCFLHRVCLTVKLLLPVTSSLY